MADQRRGMTYLDELALCPVAVRKLLNSRDRTRAYPLPGSLTDHAILTENLRSMPREPTL